jgi:serine/threonine-protein kinase
MPLEIGSKLGQYEILSNLGAGGMGEVYRAKDTKLGREVALKLLLAEVSASPDRLARFEREARVLASLNHPNVATLHGFEQEGDTSFLVMELVDGETLADRIARGPIPIEEAVPLFVRIAEGLEAAHKQGIIHRDLKPANVKVSGAGRVKILDFGLAKAMAPEAAAGSGDLSQSPTLTLAATQRGEVLGTAAYMAPEQAKGKTVDRRADVWAFGVCLFEALAGSRAFRGEDVADTLAAVLRAELDWSALPPTTPRSLRRLLRRCIRRDPGERLRDIADARLELQESLEEQETEVEQVATVSAWSRLVWPLVVVGALASGLAGGRYLIGGGASDPPAARGVTRTSVSVFPSPPPMASNAWRDVAITNDGKTVIYSIADGKGRTGLYVRPLDQLEGALVAEGTRTVQPVPSPDGEWLLYYDYADWSLKKTPMKGGPSVALFQGAQPSGADWGPDDTIVFAVNDRRGVLLVSANGGEVEVLTMPDQDRGETRHDLPQFIGSDRVLFRVRRTDGTNDAALLSLLDKTWKVVLEGVGDPRWVPTGHIVYSHEGSLWAAPFDPDQGQVARSPTPILDGVVTKINYPVGDYDFSDSGRLVYLAGAPFGSPASHLVWVDRQGNEERVELPRRNYDAPRLSPDGSRVLMFSYTDGDLWIWNFARGTLSRFAEAPENLFPGPWTPSGDRIYFSGRGPLGSGGYEASADGTGEARYIGEGTPASISPDGLWLVTRNRTSNDDLHLTSLVDGGSRPLLDSPVEELLGRISPNGKWLAYQAGPVGRQDVYLASFPDVEQKRWQISQEGGVEPVWSRDGTELFFRGAGRMMAVRIDPEGETEPGSPTPLFDDRWVDGYQRAVNYDVHPDGRFLMLERADLSEEELNLQVIVVDNWFDELERLVPTE